jgi:hypothetical protein
MFERVRPSTSRPDKRGQLLVADYDIVHDYMPDRAVADGSVSRRRPAVPKADKNGSRDIVYRDVGNRHAGDLGNLRGRVEVNAAHGAEILKFGPEPRIARVLWMTVIVDRAVAEGDVLDGAAGTQEVDFSALHVVHKTQLVTVMFFDRQGAFGPPPLYRTMASSQV